MPCGCELYALNLDAAKKIKAEEPRLRDNQVPTSWMKQCTIHRNAPFTLTALSKLVRQVYGLRIPAVSELPALDEAVEHLKFVETSLIEDPAGL